MRAVDLDEGSVVAYAISAGNPGGLFLMGKEDGAGIVRLNGRLDFATKPLHSLTIRATDQTGKADTATVWVAVADVNSPPRFAAQPLRLSVAESEGVGATVAVVEAEDGDAGPNARLAYTLQGAHGHFAIHERDGIITVAK